MKPVLAALLLIFITHAPYAQEAVLLPQLHQEIKGWGCFPSYCRTDWDRTGHTWDITDKPLIQKMLYTDLGINYVRVDIQPRFYDCTTGRLNERELLDMVTHLRQAQARGVTKWIISVWSPPCCMKTPGHIDGEINQWTQNPTDCRTGGTIPSGTSTRLDPTKVGAFCQYMVDVLLYLKNAGVGTPDNISPQNEPLHHPGYDGCVYNNWSMAPADRQLYQSVIKTLRRSLDAAALNSVRIMAAEGNDFGHHPYLMGSEYADLGTDAELHNAVGVIGSHSYDQWGSDVNKCNAHANGAKRYDKEIWMSEWMAYNGPGTCIPDGSDLDLLIGTARHLIRELVIMPTEYWFWWLGYVQSGSAMEGGTLINGSGSSPSVTKRYHFLQRLWNEARPGSAVRHFSCTDPDLIVGNTTADNVPDTALQFNLIGFESDTNQVVAIVNHTTSAKQLRVSGLSVTSVHRWVSTATQDMASQGAAAVASGALSVALPARSVTVLSGRKAGTVARTSPAHVRPLTPDAGRAYDVRGSLRRGREPLATGLTVWSTAQHSVTMAVRLR